MKNFFKGCLQEGILAVKLEVLKKAAAEAVQIFLLLMVDELEDKKVSKAELRFDEVKRFLRLIFFAKKSQLAAEFQIIFRCLKLNFVLVHQSRSLLGLGFG